MSSSEKIELSSAAPEVESVVASSPIATRATLPAIVASPSNKTFKLASGKVADKEALSTKTGSDTTTTEASTDDSAATTQDPETKLPHVLMGVFSVVLMILYGVFTEYSTAYEDLAFDADFELKYPWFQDVHIMIFVGFGFLMVYLKYHGFSSIGFNYLVASLTILWSILTNSFFHQLVGFTGNGIWNVASAYSGPFTIVEQSSVLGNPQPTNNTYVFTLADDTHQNSQFTITGSSAYDTSMAGLFEHPATDYKMHKISLSMDNIITADFTAAACLISFGAVLGKVNPTQLLIMVILESIFFAINESMGANMLAVSDIGGSIFVHLFGAIFGVAMSKVVTRKTHILQSADKQTSDTTSDLFSMVGSIFLFCFWPSFNGALASGEGRHRVVINTVIALAGSCVATFMISGLVSDKKKYLMEHVQNAALAGGVAVGSSADLIIQPWGALIIGLFAGIVSTFGFAVIKPYLERAFKLHDSCGVLHLHGLPAVVGALGGTIATFAAPPLSPTCTQYSATAPSWETMQQTMAASGTTEELFNLLEAGCTPAQGRSIGQQAGMQFAATIITVAIAAAGGVITGLVMRQSCFNPVNNAFHDDVFWELEDDEDEEAPLLTAMENALSTPGEA